MTVQAPTRRDRQAKARAQNLPMLTWLVCLTTLASAGTAAALPTVSDSFSLTASAGSWIQGSYVLGFAFSTAVFGRLADLFGLTVVRRFGLGLFAVGAAAAAAAWTPALLFTGRLVEGAGGGAIPVLASCLLAAIGDESRRQRAVGNFTAVLTGASALGPLAGGLLASWLHWRVLVALPVLGLLAMPRGGPDIASRQSAGQAARREGALMPALIRNRSFVTASAVGFALFAAYFGLLFLVPVLMARGEHWGPNLIGLSLLPAGMVGAGCSLLSGKLTTRGRRRPARAAVCLAAAAAVFLCAAAPMPWVWVAAMGIASGALGIGNTALLGQIADDVPARWRGAALGMFNVCFFLGGTVATVLTGSLLDVAGRAAAASALACLPLLAVIPAAARGRYSDGEGKHRT